MRNVDAVHKNELEDKLAIGYLDVSNTLFKAILGLAEIYNRSTVETTKSRGCAVLSERRAGWSS